MILIGTVLGAGIFAVPFVIQKAGVSSILIYFPVLFFLQLIIHLIYAEIILSTKSRHRMVGYVGVYFNKVFKDIALLIALLGKHGTLIAYIILGGIFFYQLLSPIFGGTELMYISILFAIESFLVLFGLKIIAKAETFLTGLLMVVIVGLGFKSLGYWDAGNFNLVNLEHVLLPYGTIFFAIGGQAAIPEICRLLKKEKEKIRSAVILGTFIPTVLVAAFAFLMVGVAGPATTPDLLVGLGTRLDSGMMILALGIGLLAVTTSYMVISQALREIYWWDLGMNKNWAWFWASLIPFLLFLIGANDLNRVVGITGAITGGLFGIILILVYFKVKKKSHRTKILKVHLSKGVAWVLSLAFIAGVISELIILFK